MTAQRFYRNEFFPPLNFTGVERSPLAILARARRGDWTRGYKIYPSFICSYMGRGVIEAPAEEIAEFLSHPEAPLSYDNHVVVYTFYLAVTHASLAIYFI